MQTSARSLSIFPTISIFPKLRSSFSLSFAISQVKLDRVVLVSAILQRQVNGKHFDRFFEVPFFIFGLVTIFFLELQVRSRECMCVVCVSNVMAEVGSALASDAFLVAAAQDDLLLP